MGWLRILWYSYSWLDNSVWVCTVEIITGSIPRSDNTLGILGAM
jgi:hypothetical protein